MNIIKRQCTLFLFFQGQNSLHTPRDAGSVSRTKKETLYIESPPSPSRIDPEFLAALPDDMRQEIELTYQLRMPKEKASAAVSGEADTLKRSEFAEPAILEQKNEIEICSETTQV